MSVSKTFQLYFDNHNEMMFASQSDLEFKTITSFYYLQRIGNRLKV